MTSMQTGLRKAEKEKKKILDTNYVPTQPKLENLKKKIAKKLKKIKKHHSGTISL